MKKLYYSTCAVAAPHIGVVIDDIISSKKQGHDVYWAYCHCALSTCFKNLDGYNSICKLCHRMYGEYQKVYGSGVHMLPIKSSDLKQKSGTALSSEVLHWSDASALSATLLS